MPSCAPANGIRGQWIKRDAAEGLKRPSPPKPLLSGGRGGDTCFLSEDFGSAEVQIPLLSRDWKPLKRLEDYLAADLSASSGWLGRVCKGPHPPAPSPDPLCLRAAWRRGESPAARANFPLPEGEGLRVRAASEQIDHFADTP